MKLKGRARQDTPNGAVKIVQGASIDSKRFLVKLPDGAIVAVMAGRKRLFLTCSVKGSSKVYHLGENISKLSNHPISKPGLLL